MIYIADLSHSESHHDSNIFVEADDEDEANDIAKEQAKYLYGLFGKVNDITCRADIFIHSNEQEFGHWVNLNKSNLKE